MTKQKKKRNLIKRFLPYYKPHLSIFIKDTLCATIVAAVELAFPMLVRVILNDGINTQTGIRIDLILQMGAVILAIRILDMFCNYYIESHGHIMGAKIETDMRIELFQHLQNLSFSYYDNNKVGQIMSRITNDLFEITEFSHHCPEEFYLAGLKIVGAFILLCTISVPLTLIIFAILPLMFCFAYFYNKKMRRAFKQQKEQIGEINVNVEDCLNGIRVVKSFANEQIEEKKFYKTSDKFLDIKRISYHFMGVFHSGIRFFDAFMYLAVVVFGGLFIAWGIIQTADLVTYLLFISMLLNSVSRIVQFMEQYQRGITGLERFFEIMDAPIDITDAPNASQLTQVRGDVCFDNVSFQYDQESQTVLSHINLTVQAGSNIAIVGPSGSGKTTLCSLIPRFYDVTEGCIKIDGTDIKKVTQHSLRSNIGVVAQDVYMFSGTVRENIAYGNPGASFEQIVEAAKLAGADEFIKSLPDGYNTYVGEHGTKLSGGQKQRISIARVFLKNPPILIFDEATSALDNESERIVQQSLDLLAKGRTTFIIAHRLSTIRNADLILVLTEKGIEEIGTHTELLAKKGVYYKLYEIYAGSLSNQ